MFVTEPARIFHIHDFDKNDFPIEYDRGEFPNGFQIIEVKYNKEKAYKAYLHGTVESIIEVKPSELEKVLRWVQEKRLGEQTAEATREQ